MDSEQWKRLDNVLQAALDHAPEERDAFLQYACAGDETLEREVRSLLKSEKQAGRFLENPAIEVAAREIAQREEETTEISGSLAGQTISHYRVVEKLGAGGMGVVWKARDTRLDRFVALKFLTAAKMSDAERKRRFALEARAASALNHPNIITIYEIDQAAPEGRAADFIAMEFVLGKTLGQLIPQKGLRLDEALKYSIQVADALAAAHAAGIVHRDLKPRNIMVTANGSVKVLDFGLAKLIEQTAAGELAPGTEAGVIVGTVSYMSPEQAEGKKVDARTDIFSFGSVLYEIITGRRAFVGDSTASVLSAILRDDPKPAAELAPGLPRDLGRIVTRCLQKDPDRRYQHAGDLKIDLQQVLENLSAGGSATHGEVPSRRSTHRWWLGAVVACMAVSLVAWRLHETRTGPPASILTRLTADAGLSSSPALSPDGKLVAYSSDLGLDGAQDLYIRQVAGGQSIRLTSDGAGNTMPDFSPDGSRIVFRSSRNGGGIYEIPTFGGEARGLARDGLDPRFSPDGAQIAYWVGARNVSAAVPGSGTLWMVPVAGGQPRRVGGNFTGARYPIWSGDGRHLLFIGYTSSKAYESSSFDWWLLAPDGATAVKTGASEALAREGLRSTGFNLPGNQINLPRPECWSRDNTVIFSAYIGDTLNLWAIGISPRTGKVSSAPRRLTTGAGFEIEPTCESGGGLAFTKAETRRDLWSLPFDPDRGISRGPMERITQGPAYREHLSFSSDGRFVAFGSDQSGGMNIWTRDLATGKESNLARSSLVQRYPVSDASGARIAFSVYEKDQRAVYVSALGGTPEKLCEGCLRATDWSRDEKSLLMFGGNPYSINALDIATHRQIPLLKHADFNLLYARFSPDNRWVSFTARIRPDRGRIAIAPLDGSKPVPESAWITIAEAGAEDWANWSPDGKTLYFTSNKDGYECLWGQRLEAGSHHPAGEAFAVQHFHGRVSYQQGGWSAAGGRIGLVLAEATGNIWMMSRSAAH